MFQMSILLTKINQDIDLGYMNACSNFCGFVDYVDDYTSLLEQNLFKKSWCSLIVISDEWKL